MERLPTLGSLFDGIGGFPLAGIMCGITPVWSSEIEAFPLKVTAARFPNVKQLGSVLDIDGAKIEPVDIITFGSPCQDLSVAGKQAGIHEGQRSSLFFEAIRIIREMREHGRATGRADHDLRPRFAVWENVPGAFSSNGGADFKAVLEAFAGVREDRLSIPRPKKWNHAGCVVGHGWSLAWRVYDAQYWPGTPQRRKRIYLIADFASERAGEILFERESVRGDFAEGRAAREGVAADAERSAGRSCFAWTYRGRDGGCNVEMQLEKAYCLREPSGGGSQPYLCYPVAFMGGQGAKARSIAYCDDGTVPTLKTSLSGGNAVPEVCYALQGNVIDRADTAGCSGCGWRTDEMYTLNTVDRPAVVFSAGSEKLPSSVYEGRGNGSGNIAPTMAGDHFGRTGDYSAALVERTMRVNGSIMALDCRNMTGNDKLSGTLQAKNNGGFSLNYMNPVVYAQQRIGQYVQDKIGSTEMARDYKSAKDLIVESAEPPRKYIVRRLTPTECARLQGFPDEWCDGLGGSDGAIYKAYGNGLALPCAYDVLSRIAKEMEANE